MSTENNDITLIETSDGSHSLFVRSLNETYHSRHGAMQESQWVFIKQGLDFARPPLREIPELSSRGTVPERSRGTVPERSRGTVSERSRGTVPERSRGTVPERSRGMVPERSRGRILEVGFGTGLNALLAMRWAEEHQVHVHFTTLETNVLPMEVAEQLNYCETDISEKPEFERSREQLSSQQSPVPERSRGQRSRGQRREGQEYRERFLQMHSSPWNQDISITPYFTLHKALREVQTEASEEQFDVIFFDAFGPPTQPEMWTPVIFQRMFNALKSGGILVTYCAKGQVRRDMQSVGFTVERLPGPPGKREMLRATKPAHHG